MAEKKLKVAIVGLGAVSFAHKGGIENSKLGDLVAVCDHNGQKLDSYIEDGIKGYTDLETMLAEEELDVVHICLPHDLHTWAAKVCLDKGVHVFLEKPIAHNYQEAKEIRDYARTTPAKVAVSFQNRYNNTSAKLKELLQDQETYGRVTAIKGLVIWYRPEEYYKEKKWRGLMDRAGGGSIINQAIHTLDLIQWYGGRVKSGKAKLSQLMNYDIEVEDTAVARFELEDGVIAYFNSTNAYAVNSSVEVEVVTEKTKFKIKNGELRQYGQNGFKVLTEDIKFVDAKSYYGASHTRAINSFYQAIVDDSLDFVRLTDGLEAMLMVDLMQKSSEEDRTIYREEIETND